MNPLILEFDLYLVTFNDIIRIKSASVRDYKSLIIIMHMIAFFFSVNISNYYSVFITMVDFIMSQCANKWY